MVEDARELRSIRDAFSTFVEWGSPRHLVVFSVALLCARVALALLGPGGALTWADLALAAAVLVVVWPVQEWVLHQYVLHLRPFELRGRRIDPEFAQGHRAHHRRPWVIDDMLLGTALVDRLMPVTLLVWWLVTPTPALALTGAASYALAATAYEWIHFLTHTGYSPTSAWFRRVRRNHRYHHYKNERYWYAFTLPVVDGVLGTDPEVRAVESSRTARTLGVEDPEDDGGAG